MTEKIVMTKSHETTASLFGAFDSNARKIERAFDVRISNCNLGDGSGDAISVQGEADAVARASAVLEYLKRMIGEGEVLSEQSVDYVIGLCPEELD